MDADESERQRRTSWYRGVFRAGLVAVAAGVALVLAGLYQETTLAFPAGLLLISLGGLNAYRATVSTVKIIDLEVGGDWRRLKR